MRRHGTDIRVKERAVDLRPFVLLLVVAVLALALAMSPRSAYGLSLDLTPDQMLTVARDVVTADVTSVTCYPDASEGIVTRVELRPVRRIKGDAGPTLTLELPGGTLGDLSLVVSEVPGFVVGERAVVFVGQDGRTVAGQHGKLSVANGMVTSTGEPLALLEARLLGSEFPTADALADSLAPSSTTVEDPPAVTQDIGTLAIPTVTNISPTSAPAGIGAVIKITGSGFGTYGVSSSVEFYYRGTTPIVASGSDIKSWTDTQIQVEVPVGEVDGYPASASSGPVTVVANDGSRSAGTNFTVTFSYGGSRWPDLEQDFYIYENTSDYAGEGTLVRNAATSWSGESSFALTYAGTTAAPVSGNSLNEIWWADGGNTSILAEARYWYWGEDLFEADVTFNDYYYWGTGSVSTSFDIQTVALHEFGHWLSLRDLYGSGDSGDAMYGVCAPGTQKRSLSADDSAGVRWIYDGTDVFAPVTTVSGVPAGWTTQPATLTLDATDETEPITTYYRIGAGTIQTYSAPFLVSGEGAIGVRYWSIDGEGNTEEAQTATVRIDTLPPTTVVSGPASGYERVELDFIATDPSSGVATTYYRIDGGATQTGTSAVITGIGTHSVEAWSRDAVGNVETPAAPFVTRVDPAPDIDLDRLSGTDRYQTAAAVSAATFSAASADTAVLATGAQFADALSASGLAGAYGGPLLLTKQDALPSAVEDELERLGVDDVVIVGGTGAVGQAVASKLDSLGYDVDRLSGADRYQTAAAVARRIAQVAGAPTDAFVARGDSFADALAAAPYAYSLQAPILLVTPTTMPSATSSVLTELVGDGLTDVTIAGGTSAVSSGIENSIEARGVDVARASGATRYATAAALARLAIARGWTQPTVIGVTTGENFPDALGGGVAIGANAGAVLLTRSAVLSPEAEAVLLDCSDDLETIEILGGESAVSEDVVDEIKALWNLP